MLVIYKTIPAAEIRKDAKKAITQITAWFKKNPHRKECNTSLWYGESIVIKPDTIAAQINAAAEKAISRK